MRNLKRALSLALASVMLLGLMVVGTGASYKDVTSEYNQEAIEVLQAVGIMVGDDKGNFNPSSNVTRNEMAVIMSNLMDYRVASYSGTSPFTDVPSWAEPYVAACYTNGITSGIGATTYGGDQTVTTAQAALMLMKALGYFQYQSDFEDDWMLATTKQANKIDLFDNVDAGVREAMTRNDVAQLVLNTLKSGTVEADNDTIKVTTDSAIVETGSVKYNYLTSNKSYAEAISDAETGTGAASSNKAGAIIELGEKLYQGDLKLDDSAVDGFNAPASKWTYKAVEIGTYAEGADYTYTGEIKSKTLYSAVGKDAAKTYDWYIYLNGDEGSYVTPYKDKEGKEQGGAKGEAVFTQSAVTANDNAGLKATGRGTTTYVYVDDDENTVTVCIVETFGAEITKVDDGTIYLDDNDLDFDVEGYDEEDIVVYTKSYDGSNWTVEAVLGEAEYVEGDVDQVKNIDTVIIDGNTYKYNTTVEASDKITIDSYDQTVGFYLDKQGHIVRVDDAIESGDYAYVISMGNEGDKYGSGDFTAYAKMVLSDGTIVKAEIDDDDYVQVGGKDNFAATKTKFEGKIVSYDVEDGVYSLNVKTSVADAKDLKIENGTTRIMNIPNNTSSKSVYGDANTVYLIADDSDDDDYTAYVGYKKVPDVDGKTMVASDKSETYTQAGAYVKNGVAKFVFIADAKTKASVDDVLFVIGRTSEKEIKSSAGNYYEYKAVVNGETTTIKVKTGSKAEDAFWAAMNATKVEGKTVDKQVLAFRGMTENSKGLVTDLEAWYNESDGLELTKYIGTKRLSSSSGLVGFAYNTTDKDYTTWLGADDDATVAYYEPVGGSLSDVGTINSLKTDNNDEAYVITDEGTIIAILVKEFK